MRICRLLIGVPALVVAGCFASAASAQIYTDSLSSGANWTTKQTNDASFAFGFDYSTKGLPLAPNGSDSIGLKLEVNNGDASPGSETIGVFTSVASLPTEYTVRVDIWANWAPDNGTIGQGTTEFVGASVGHDALLSGPFGASFMYSSDADSSLDYRLYQNEVELQSEDGGYDLGTTAGSRNHTNPLILEAFPEIDIATAVPTQGSTGVNQAGAAGFQWMTVNIEVDTDSIGPAGLTSDVGFARFSMKSASSGRVLAIGTVDNSNNANPEVAPIPLGNQIALLMSDLSSSVTVDPNFSFSIFDNLQVFDGLLALEPDVAPSAAGDFNADGLVDAADYTLWRDNSGDADETAIGFNGDGLDGVDAKDLQLWKDNYGTDYGVAAASIAAPEPGALVLLTAAAGLAARRRRTVGC
ncbi:hypothetical protein Pla123a_36870 [Posidoniimonas polymericola]|uniref:PEP-CTERM protein-sorting domain-containing protein n=1 Tax=Posidoniimonas polymericola TaxID=2528002 RepID=A0A5C5YG10_9BACT|nr:PEP-CTERM sorting domain-containing protein [Posidoniimonas polymericola]TWT73793.1 hypothetical protein Pla123a_36870 [Posidoniimonas polymericola]